MADAEFAPVTPGEILKEEFLAEYELSQNQLARHRLNPEVATRIKEQRAA